jgi:hypothetical protein
VLPLMQPACGDGCHNSGEVPFLTVGLEYVTITTYLTKEVAVGSSFIVPNPESSILVIYPGTDDHSGDSWDDGNNSELRGKIVEWLAMEAELIDPDALLEVGPIDPEGLVVLPLDSIAPQFAGFSLSFYAIEHGDPPALLELVDISVWPPNGRGLRVVNPSFVVVPAINAVPFVDVSFHGDPQIFVAPNNTKMGPGELLLTTWGPDYRLAVRFEALSALFADVQGNTFVPCTRLDLYVKGVEELPIQAAGNAANGLSYCADQCHGGTNGADPTTVMDLKELLFDPPAYDFACAKTRVFITPTNAAGSALMTATDPQGSDPHVFAFQGNLSSFNKFKTAMTPWIDQEGAEAAP